MVRDPKDGIAIRQCDNTDEKCKGSHHHVPFT